MLGCVMNRQGKAYDAQGVLERYYEKDKSKDIPRKIKCRRLVDHVLAVFSFGSKNLTWT